MKPLMLNEIIDAMRGRFMGSPSGVSVTGVSIDSRTLKPGELFFSLPGERADGHQFIGQALQRGATVAVVSRAELFDGPHRNRLILVKETTEALCRLAAYYRRQIAATVIAVTGSNGKTTTREMIWHLLSASRPGRRAPKSYNNRIGVPLTLLETAASDQFLVTELGSSAPGEIDHLAAIVRPDVGVLVSIGPAHLKGLGSLHGVAREKLSMFAHLRDGGLAVIPADDPLARLDPTAKGRRTVANFVESPDATIRLTQFHQEPDGIQFQYNGRFDVHMPVLGRFNALNALAAILVAKRFNISDADIAARLHSFQPPEMRLQRLRLQNVEIILDAYNANPASTNAAIDVLDATETQRRLVLVAGDMEELGPQSRELHRRVGRRVATSRIKTLVTVGRHAASIAAECRTAVRCHRYRDTDQAIDAIADWLQPGDLVLFKGSRAMRLERIVQAIGSPKHAPASG